MGQILHGSATTTHAIREAIQRSQASSSQLSKTCGITPKTVAKWRNRKNVNDAAMEPKDIKSSVLSIEEEAAIVTFRRHTLLPLDDCLWTTAFMRFRPAFPTLRAPPFIAVCSVVMAHLKAA